MSCFILYRMDSKLQIISGQYKGRKLKLPPLARPTQNRARIALFNMIESGIIDKNTVMNIWDAFAGSGAFGLECISRYPNARVLFTDVAATSVKTVRDNLSVLKADSRASVVQTDAIAVINKYAPDTDIVFLDPPYDMHDLGISFVRQFGRHAKIDSVVIWEQDSVNFVMPDTSVWDVLRDKTYGRARFLILKKI